MPEIIIVLVIIAVFFVIKLLRALVTTQRNARANAAAGLRAPWHYCRCGRELGRGVSWCCDYCKRSNTAIHTDECDVRVAMAP